MHAFCQGSFIHCSFTASRMHKWNVSAVAFCLVTGQTISRTWRLMICKKYFILPTSFDWFYNPLAVLHTDCVVLHTYATLSQQCCTRTSNGQHLLWTLKPNSTQRSNESIPWSAWHRICFKMAAATMCSINSVRMLSVSTGLFPFINMRFILLHHLFSKEKLVKLVLKMYSFFFYSTPLWV